LPPPPLLLLLLLLRRRRLLLRVDVSGTYFSTHEVRYCCDVALPALSLLELSARESASRMSNGSRLNQQPAGSGASTTDGKSSADTWTASTQDPQTAPKSGGAKQADQDGLKSTLPSLPKISLPKGGGAITGIGEKFDVNPATDTGSTTIPIKITPARNRIKPQLSL
jgi:hypothetical protein